MRCKHIKRAFPLHLLGGAPQHSLGACPRAVQLMRVISADAAPQQKSIKRHSNAIRAPHKPSHQGPACLCASVRLSNCFPFLRGSFASRARVGVFTALQVTLFSFVRCSLFSHFVPILFPSSLGALFRLPRGVGAPRAQVQMCAAQSRNAVGGHGSPALSVRRQVAGQGFLQLQDGGGSGVAGAALLKELVPVWRAGRRLPVSDEVLRQRSLALLHLPHNIFVPFSVISEYLSI